MTIENLLYRKKSYTLLTFIMSCSVEQNGTICIEEWIVKFVHKKYCTIKRAFIISHLQAASIQLQSRSLIYEAQTHSLNLIIFSCCYCWVIYSSTSSFGCNFFIFLDLSAPMLCENFSSLQWFFINLQTNSFLSNEKLKLFKTSV